MSPANSTRPAWLSVRPADSLPRQVAAEIGPVAKKIDFVSDVARLRGAGFSDADILHIVEVTAIFNYNVRRATATGLFPNAGDRALGRAAYKEG